MVKDHDIVPPLTAVPKRHGELEAAQQETRPEPQQETRSQSPSPSFLNADATGGDGIIEEWHDDPYVNFFKPSQSSFPATTSGPPQPPDPSSTRHFWNSISQYSLPSIPLRNFFARHARFNSSLEAEPTKPDLSIPEGKTRARGGEEGEKDDDRCFVNDPLGAIEDKGKQLDEPTADDPLPPAKLDSEGTRNIWKRLMQARGKISTDTNIAPAMKRPEVVEVYAVRGFQRYVARTPTRKITLPVLTYSAPLATAPVGGGSSQPLSSHTLSTPAGSSSHTMVSNGARYFQPPGSQSLHVSPSHFVTTYHTTHDSDSRSSIEGSCNRFLDKICFPCGHFHQDS
ncbi:hypothetical protein EDB19DRAFT_1725095 [Suillus lakei]|nr:hypothetical protein EDB19DRAFT_1725095 [Suillus lakei]